MASTVRSRPTYYDVLGLKPTATGDEIAGAFRKALSMFRPTPFGGVAEVGIAYETLRDPEKRRRYDVSIGLGGEPKPPPRPRFVSSGVVTASGQSSSLFPISKPATQKAPEDRAQPRAASFIASALNELAAPEPGVSPPPAAKEVDALPPADGGVGPYEGPSFRQATEPVAGLEEQGVGWKRTGIAAGAVVLAVGLVGAWAGWNAGQDVEQSKAGVVTVALPKVAGSPAAAAAVAATPAPRLGDLLPDRHAQAFAAPRHRERAPYLAQRQEVRTAPEQDAKPASGGFEEVAATQAVSEAPAIAEPPAATVTSASMPLPNKVIAQTIHRIGYSCGNVASTSAVEGSSGVFTVTCTSGETYQASPVRGRYHFRKVASH